MKFTYSPYILPLILAAVVSGWVVIYAWRRRNIPEATALSLMAFAITEWLLGYALEIAGIDLPTKLFWGKSQYIGITLVPLVWFIFSHYYANQNKQIALRYLLLLMRKQPILSCLNRSAPRNFEILPSDLYPANY